jgi:CRISPR-associated protein Cas5t
MPIVVAEAVAPVASWRPPEALTYHRTLPLPPYTALIGVVGAALGLELAEAYRFVADHGLRLGVGGWCEGRARDLWKYQKLESIAEGKAITSDVLLRELWIDARLVFVVECGDDADAEIVARALSRPRYPLTAGTSDALLKVVAVRLDHEAPRSSRLLAFSMVYGELSPKYKLAEALDKIPLSRVIRAPSVERLPTGFVFDPVDPRRLSGRDLVTFVSDPIELEDGVEPIVGYAVKPVSRVLRESSAFQSLGEDRPWIIPVHRYDSPRPEALDSSTTPSPKGKTPPGAKKDSRTGGT